MKKLLTLTAVALAFSMTPVLADNHEGHGDKGKKFEKHDLNGDGIITKDEFLSGASERFGKMDANGDGSVSKEEAKTAKEEMKAKRMEKRGERKEKRAEKLEEKSEAAE